MAAYRCEQCQRPTATVQVAVRRRRDPEPASADPHIFGVWHVSGPLCVGCAAGYGHGGVVRFDAREDLPL